VRVVSFTCIHKAGNWNETSSTWSYRGHVPDWTRPFPIATDVQLQLAFGCFTCYVYAYVWLLGPDPHLIPVREDLCLVLAAWVTRQKQGFFNEERLDAVLIIRNLLRWDHDKNSCGYLSIDAVMVSTGVVQRSCRFFVFRTLWNLRSLVLVYCVCSHLIWPPIVNLPTLWWAFDEQTQQSSSVMPENMVSNDMDNMSQGELSKGLGTSSRCSVFKTLIEAHVSSIDAVSS